ncbi:MAG: HD domain-containing protein, partial [Candidatus Omnitrophica bacterium]|nr:HD domain-containing protein [Candidatus Omnitrophota bacterium]
DIPNQQILQEIKRIDPQCIIVVIVKDKESMGISNPAWVYEIINWPISVDKLSFLVRKGIELYSILSSNYRFIQSLKEQNINLQKQNTLLAKRIEEATTNLSRLYENLRTTYMRAIKALAQAIDARDHYTRSHSERVREVAVAIAEEMALSLRQIESISEACELHDLGKIGIPDEILLKPGPLTPEEFEKIKKHPEISGQILEPLTFLNEAIEIVKQHHEHYDGSGYPRGLKGEEILLGARILHIADAYEAMCAERVYRKKPFTKEEAISEIKKNSGKQFDPKVVEAFLRVVNKI